MTCGSAICPGDDFCQWQLVGGYDTTPITFNGKATTVGGGIFVPNRRPEHLLHKYWSSVSTPVPGGRLGAATWKDTAGNFWMFGGSNGNNFIMILWCNTTTTASRIHPLTRRRKERGSPKVALRSWISPAFIRRASTLHPVPGPMLSPGQMPREISGSSAVTAMTAKQSLCLDS